MPKLGNPSEWFWGQTRKTIATGFEAKPRETVHPGFEAKPRNPRSMSPHARCRPHMTSPDLPIVRSQISRRVPNHLRSSAPSLLLLPRSVSLPTMSHLPPTHHEISKHVSPNRITQFGVSSTEMHWSQIQTKSNQLLITQINQGTNHLVSHGGTVSKGVALGFHFAANEGAGLTESGWR
jgi:hypothetical protein